MVISHKTHNPIDSSVKFVTFIDAMLSLVVTQNVLLGSQGTAHAVQSSGLFGIGLGVVTDDHRLVDVVEAQVDGNGIGIVTAE